MRNRLTLRSHERLRLTARFLDIHRRGTWVRERALTVGILPNELPVTRIGLRVKHGVAGAVDRNRAKRIFRTAYRQHKNRLAAGWDIVAVLTRTRGLAPDELTREWLLACSKLKILVPGDAP